MENFLKRPAIILENTPFHASKLLQDFVDSQRYRLTMIHILKKGKVTGNDVCVQTNIKSQKDGDLQYHDVWII